MLREVVDSMIGRILTDNRHQSFIVKEIDIQPSRRVGRIQEEVSKENPRDVVVGSEEFLVCL